MFKPLITAVALAVSLWAGAASAATDVNQATQAELESVKGIGPGLSGRILDERKKNTFKDWDDLMTRVKGVGPGNAGKFSEGGLTVAGAAYKGSAPKAAAAEKPAKEAKPAKTDAKAGTAK